MKTSPLALLPLALEKNNELHRSATYVLLFMSEPMPPSPLPTSPNTSRPTHAPRSLAVTDRVVVRHIVLPNLNYY